MQNKPFTPAMMVTKPTKPAKPVPKGGARALIPRPPMQPEPYTEYKLRVPKNLVKRYNVMKVNNPRPVKLENTKEANMVRKTKKQLYVEEDTAAMPTYGAGSVYNYERKEEARKKRRGYIPREVKTEDLPYALRLDGKGGKRYTGRKEPILDHSAYYILTQCPDGVFEAIPVKAWYNFMPDIDYNTLTADEVEQEFSKRDRTLSYFTKKYQLGNSDDLVNAENNKVKRTNDGVGLMIHDDDKDGNELEDFDDPPSDDESSSNSKKKKGPAKKSKNMYGGKKRKSGNSTQDSDEEEDLDNMESKEVDYMSESSSEDELTQMDDEPDPEKNTSEKAKDELNIFSDSEGDDDDEDDKQLNDAGKELKAMLKKESGVGSSDDEDEEDEDIDSEYSKSALFIQGKDGKKKKGKSGSNGGSKPTSRSSTPVQLQEQTSDTLNQAAKTLKEGLKRSHDSSSTPSPTSKKQKLHNSVATSSKRSSSPHTTLTDRSASPVVRSGTPSDGGHSITEEAIRRYLTHKPMTTTDIMKKFKTKKTGLTKEQTVNAIAAILKKIQPHQEKIDGKLYLSIKTKK